MERKLLLVFALTFLAILLFQPLLKKYGPQPPAEPERKTQPAAKPETPASPPKPETPAPLKGVTKQASSEAETVIENNLYKITFTNRGAQVKSWILKKFDDDQGKPLELVNPAAAPKYGFPLSLWAYDEGIRNKLNSALYVASESGALSAPANITFEYGDQDVAVVKKFSFDHSYVVRVETSVRYKGGDLAAFPVWPSGLGDESSPASYAASQIQYEYNEKVERLAIKKISGGGTLNGPFHWAGVVDQYFAAVFLPEDPPSAAMITHPSLIAASLNCCIESIFE